MSVVPALTIRQLFEKNQEELQMEWVGGHGGGSRLVSANAASAADQIGHLNLIHPERIHVFGRQEIQYYNRLPPEARAYQIHELIDANPPAIIVARDSAISSVESEKLVTMVNSKAKKTQNMPTIANVSEPPAKGSSR